MNILITGGSGFIGFNITMHILNSFVDVNITNYARSNPKYHILDDRYSYIKGDILNYETLVDALMNVDYVIHCAAILNKMTPSYDENNMLMINFVGTNNVFKACLKCNIKKIVHVSTTNVYGSQNALIVDELSPCYPSSLYGVSKAASELLALHYYDNMKLPVIIPRISSAYGLFQSTEALVPKFLQYAMAGKKLPIYGSGLKNHDWINVIDVCEAIVMLMLCGKTGDIYNVATSIPMSILNIVEIIASITSNSTESIKYIIMEPEKTYSPYVISNEKMLNTFNWRPKISITEGINLLFTFYKSGYFI